MTNLELKSLKTVVTILLFMVCTIVYSQLMPRALQPKSELHKLEIDIEQIKSSLSSNRSSSIALNISNNATALFRAEPIKVMEDKFYTIYPMIKHYKVESFEGSNYIGIITITPDRMWSTIRSQQGIISLYPDHKGSHLIEPAGFRGKKPSCAHDSNNPAYITPNWTSKIKELENSYRGETFSFGEQRHQYRMAVVCTGEYYQANGDNGVPVAASVSSSIAGFNVVYNNELNVNFQGLNPFVGYSDPGSDPFDPADDRTEMASTEVNNRFGSNTYDIGHVFHTHEEGDGWETGGVAALGSVCDNDPVPSQGWIIAKAAGWSGSFSNNGFGWISLACHEIGHMFGAEHTFNGTGESCTSAISNTSAYEIASGNTIMSYNGICQGDQNVPSNGEADNYFHTRSLFQMTTYINTEATCGITTNTNNTSPQVNADPCGQTYILPEQTPYILKGSAIDNEGNDLTYTWEQYDEDGENNRDTQGEIGLFAANNLVGPLTKCYPPSSNPVRTVPPLSTVVSGVDDPFEVLSRQNREITYQLTVRDNNPQGGAIATSEIILQNTTDGPLTVSSPGTISTEENLTINWNTAGSEGACNTVIISLSIDNGVTFPYVLSTDIDYSAETFNTVLPASIVNTNEARLRVECSDSDCFTFYNISPSFRIISDCEAPTTYVCDTDPEVFDQGDEGLNLDLTTFIGNEINNLALTITNSSGIGTFIANQASGNGCNEQSNLRFESARVFATQTGDYTIRLDTSQGTPFIAIFRASDYNLNNLCSSFVAATATDANQGTGSVFVLPSTTASLTACEEYIIHFYNFVNPSPTIIESISGPSNLVLVDDGPDPDYGLTYIAVDDAGVVISLSNASDFRSLPGGNYTIYSLSFKQSGGTPPAIVDAGILIGSRLTDVLADGNCILHSTVGKPIEVISGCSVLDISLGNQTECDPETNTYQQVLTITYENPPSGGRIRVVGAQFMQEYAIAVSPQMVNIQGLPSDGQPVTVTVNFTNDESCSLTIEELFEAPKSCCPLEIELGDTKTKCANDPPPLLDAGSEGVAYEWTLDGNLIIGETNSTLIADQTGLYGVNVLSDIGCTSTDAVQVNILENPMVVLPPDTTYCGSSPLTIEGDVTFGDLQWIKDGTDILGENSTTLEITESGQYILLAFSDDFCIHDDTINVEFIPGPSVDLGPDQDLCADESPVILDAGPDGTNYTWFRGTVMLSEQSQMLSVDQSGLYIVSVEANGGCTVNDTVSLEFFDIPTADAGNDQNICEDGDNIELFFSAFPSDYIWFKDGSIHNSQDDPVIVDGPGEYVLQVRNEIGCSVTDTVIITEVMPPAVDLGPDKVGCVGSEVVLSTDIIGTYFWILQGTGNVGNESELTVTEPGEYTLVVSNGSPGSECSGSDMVSVSFEPGPAVELGEDVTICQGEITILTANTEVSEVVWQKDGEDISGETDLTLEVKESGEYTVIASGASGCSVEDRVTVFVNPTPAVDLGENQGICDGESLTIEAGVIADNYLWTLTGVELSMMDQVEVISGGELILTVTNEFNCSTMDTINIDIGSNPTLAIEESYRFCDGNSVEIIAESDAISFEWTVNGSVASETGPSITIDEMADVIVIATNDSNCKTTETTQVEVSTSPEVELGEDQSLCPGDELVLDAGTHTSYIWSTEEDTPSITITNQGTTETTEQVVSVTVTNEDDCFETEEITLTLLPELMPMVTSSAPGVCGGEPVLLTVTGGSTFTWTDDTGTLTDIIGNTATASPTITTIYSVSAANVECPESEVSTMVTIEVYEKGEDLSAGEDECVVSGQSLELSASGGFSYQWTSEGPFEGESNIANPSVNPIIETIYYVDITDTNGCVFTDSVTICIEDNPLASFVPVSVITPNGDGDNDELVFKGLEFYPENTITIYNRWGNIVYDKARYQQDDRLWDGTNGGAELPADTYYYVLTFDGQTYKSPITIMR